MTNEMDDMHADDVPDSPTLGALELGVAGAMARQYDADSRTFLRELARLFEETLPGAVRVQRAGVFGGDSRPVRRVEVDFPDGRDAQNRVRYAIVDGGGGALTALRIQIVRGVTLKTETVTVEEWIADVGAAIARHAERSKAARDALTRLLP